VDERRLEVHKAGRPKGADACWADFTYQFTASELRHLRHGYFYDVVPGGKAFGFGAADRPTLQQFDLPPASRSGLRLELSGRRSFSYGEPVVAEIKLPTARPLQGPRRLHHHLTRTRHRGRPATQ
jgi:hypothetical protein